MNAPQREREYWVNQLFFLTFPLVGPEESFKINHGQIVAT